MKELFLKDLHISQFCGIYDYSVDFDNYNVINAENGNGKSTIIKAIKWLLGFNVADFYPTKNHIEIQDLTPMVEINLAIDNITYNLRKEWVTQYVTNPETNEKYKKSSKSKYFIDQMELIESKYKERLAELLGIKSYDVLERCIDKDFFNTDTNKWKWTDRRKLLLEMSQVGDVNSIILESTDEYDCIKDLILKGNSTSDIKSTLRKEKMGYKEKQKTNKALIDQKHIEIAEYSSIDFADIEKKIQIKQKTLDNLLKANAETAVSQILQDKQAELNRLNAELNKLKLQENNKYAEKKSILYKSYTTLTGYLSHIKFNEQSLTKAKQLLEDVKKPINTICPVCKQLLPQEKIDVAISNQESEINKYTEEVSRLENTIIETKNKYAEEKVSYDKLKQELDNRQIPVEISNLTNKIVALEMELEKAKNNATDVSTKQEEIALKYEIRDLTMELGKKQEIEKYKESIEYWKNESQELGDKIVLVDKKELALNTFVKEQCDLIESTVNNFFGNGIKFALFDIVDNQGEPTIKEACEVVWNGKSYSSMSTGEKLFVNLRICEKLQDFYDCNIFIMVDNAESITRPIESNRQLILMKAIPNTKLDALKIEDVI